MAAGSANQAQAIFDASKTCPAVAPGDHEAYHLPVATGLLPNVTFSTDWSQIPATGGWYGQQIMDNCRIKADGNVTWHGKAAARVEVQPGDDPLALGVNSERAEMLIMQTATGVQINETTASGTQYYATSYYFPSTWAGEQLPWSAFAPIDCSTGTQNQCNSWSAVFQFHGASSAVWGSLMAARTTLGGVEHYAFNGHNFTTNGNITPDKWTDFVFQINWSTGAFIVYRRDQGSVAFTQVLAGTTPPLAETVYVKQGLYRGGAVNGRTDVYWMGPTARGTTFAAVELQAFGTNNGTQGQAANTHDLNGDGKSDIVWRDTSGNLAVWLMNGAQVVQSAGMGGAPTVWTLVGQRDFNDDGKYDWLWRDNSGNVAMWFLNGAQISSSVGVGNVPTAWSVVGTADFDGDGKGDILWHDTSGNVAIWLMNGAQVTQSAAVGNASPNVWKVVGTGDFNGDGKSDILWQDTNGNVAIWSMNGLQVAQSAGVGNVPAVWSIAGTGDFNGDGKSDILWHDTSGNLAVWLMNGAQVTQSAVVGNAPPDVWKIVATGDFDGDGKSDILWQSTTGSVAIWFMNGTQITQSAGVGNVPTAWSIQGANAD